MFGWTLEPATDPDAGHGHGDHGDDHDDGHGGDHDDGPDGAGANGHAEGNGVMASSAANGEAGND